MNVSAGSGSARGGRCHSGRMPDRYADAVRARRAELRAMQATLRTYPVELRGRLTLARLAAERAAGTAVDELAGEAAAHVTAGTPHLPAAVDAAAGAVLAEVHAGWAAAVRPALRRIAAERGWVPEPAWPRLPAPHRPVPARPAPAPPGGLLTRLGEGAALGRLALLPLAVSPALVGGRALVPLAAGTGLAALGVAVAAHRGAVRRQRLHRHVEHTLAGLRTGVARELTRWTVETERTAGHTLDTELTRIATDLDRELRLLAPVPR